MHSDITGLTDSEVLKRIKEGKVNYDTDIKTLTVKQIISKNLFTLFNLLNLGIAFCIFLVGSYKNLLFLGIVICNTIISIIQELHAKRTIDKLNVISQSKIEVLRNSKFNSISIYEIVKDDVVKYKIGNQVVVDSEILDGVVEVSEAFITGEANVIVKKKGDKLISGSFIVSGSCICKVIHVGLDNYTSKITHDAKYIKKVKSVIVNTITKIIKIISFIIIPLGIVLFLRQYNEVGIKAFVSTSAAIISMIPEGLVLLTSTVFFISAMRLAKEKVLVQNLYCSEDLSRVDTICFDKTGTITTGNIKLVDIDIIDNNYDVDKILSAFVSVFKGDNKTIDAIALKYNSNKYIVDYKVPFSSDRKYSGIHIKDGSSYIMGAKEIICSGYDDLFFKYKDYRVLALMHSNDSFDGYDLPKNRELIAIIVLEDEIRNNSKEVLEFIKKEGLDIKIITGDSISSTKSILKKFDLDLNVINLDKKVSEEDILNNNVFCRVTPYQKLSIIKTLKKMGKNVAFMGDGVNDVLALKESDCSISIKDGSDAARCVSELVLMDNDFKSIPKIIKEGRRVVNNIQRSATLFLTKTTYATLLAILFLFIPMQYPFVPIQLSLISALTIGIPAFILSLEKNNDKLKGTFFINVIAKSIPSALTILFDVIIVSIISHLFHFSFLYRSTMTVMMVAFTSFILLFKVCYPFTKLRSLLFFLMISIFTICFIFFHNFFDLVFLTPYMILLLLSLFMLDIAIFATLTDSFDKMLERHNNKKSNKI